VSVQLRHELDDGSWVDQASTEIRRVWIIVTWCTSLNWHETDDGSWWIKPYWKNMGGGLLSIWCVATSIDMNWWILYKPHWKSICVSNWCVKPQLTWTDDGSWWIKPLWNNMGGGLLSIWICQASLTWNRRWILWTLIEITWVDYCQFGCASLNYINWTNGS
jgi:hypothetical protein